MLSCLSKISPLTQQWSLNRKYHHELTIATILTYILIKYTISFRAGIESPFSQVIESQVASHDLTFNTELVT